MPAPQATLPVLPSAFSAVLNPCHTTRQNWSLLNTCFGNLYYSDSSQSRAESFCKRDGGTGSCASFHCYREKSLCKCPDGQKSGRTNAIIRLRWRSHHVCHKKAASVWHWSGWTGWRKPITGTQSTVAAVPGHPSCSRVWQKFDLTFPLSIQLWSCSLSYRKLQTQHPDLLQSSRCESRNKHTTISSMF